MKFLLILYFLVSSSLAHLMSPKDRVQTSRNGPEACLSHQSVLQASSSGYYLPAYAISSNFPSPNPHSSSSAPASAASTTTPTPSPTAEPTSTGSPSATVTAPSYPSRTAENPQRTPESSLSGALSLSPSNGKLLLPSHSHQAARQSLKVSTYGGSLRGARIE